MLDLRKPIAYFFILNSVILVGYGLYKPGMVIVGNQAVNLDLLWGGVMCAFGIFMLAWSMWEQKKEVQ
jgi:hypothetical protein